MSCCFQRECSLLPWLGSPVPPGRWPVEPGPPPSHGSHGVGARPKHTANPRDQLELPSSRGATGSGPRWAARCKQCPLPPFPPRPLHPGPQLVLSDRQPQCAFLTFSSYSQSWGLLGLYPPACPWSICWVLPLLHPLHLPSTCALALPSAPCQLKSRLTRWPCSPRRQGPPPRQPLWVTAQSCSVVPAVLPLAQALALTTPWAQEPGSPLAPCVVPPVLQLPSQVPQAFSVPLNTLCSLPGPPHRTCTIFAQDLNMNPPRAFVPQCSLVPRGSQHPQSSCLQSWCCLQSPIKTSLADVGTQCPKASRLLPAQR